MSFERYPQAVATTTTDNSVIVEPGYNVEWPEEVVLAISNGPDGTVGWSTSITPNGSGATGASVWWTTRIDMEPSVVLHPRVTGQTVAVNPTAGMLAYRTVRGLMPGRQYRLSALLSPDFLSTSGTRVRLRMGGQASTWVTGVSETYPMLARAVTFTATGDEEDLILEAADNPASSWEQFAAGIHVADITVTALAYTETVPPVVDDQIALPIYSGDLTADAGWAPFVQGTVTVPMASEELGATLDPNDGSRFTITASSIRDDIPQWTDWTVNRRNLHPDPAHSGSVNALPSGTLMECYNPLTGSNYGMTGMANTFMVYELRSQGIQARHLAAGEYVGFGLDISRPGSTATKCALDLTVSVSTLIGSAPLPPSTVIVVVRVRDRSAGNVVIVDRTFPFPASVTSHPIQTVLNLPNGPSSLSAEVYIANRGNTTWTTDSDIFRINATLQSNAFALMDGDVPVLPFVSDTTPVPPASAGVLRYRKDAGTIVEETREAAEPIIGIVDEREFDLALASRELDYERGEMTLTLATDEYLLQRHSKTTNDTTPRDREHSLRSVIEYVTGEALGVVPPLAGTEDADVTARWAVTNMLLNPSVEGVLAPWTPAGNCTLFHAGIGRTGTNSCGVTSTSAGAMAVAADEYPTARQSVTPGDFYVFSGYGRLYQTPARSLAAVIRFYDQNGMNVWGDNQGADVAMSAANWNARAHVIARAPEGAATAVVFFRVYGSTAGGQIVYLDDAMFYEGTELVEPFTGSTGTTGGYTHAWSSAVNASHSTRTPITSRPVEALTWAAGQTAWDFLSPLVSGAGLRLFCDESRTWRLIDPATYTAPGSMTVTPANTVEGKDIIDGERGEYAEGVVIHWSWTDDNGVERSATETAGTEGKVTTVEMNAPYPGEGTAAAHLAQLQKRASARPVTVATDYRATPDQPVSVTLPDSDAATGELSSVKWDLTTGLMQLEPTALEAL